VALTHCIDCGREGLQRRYDGVTLCPQCSETRLVACPDCGVKRGPGDGCRCCDQCGTVDCQETDEH
jgi:hypothetical protein